MDDTEDEAVEALAEAVEEAPLADLPSRTAGRMVPAITPLPSARTRLWVTKTAPSLRTRWEEYKLEG